MNRIWARSDATRTAETDTVAIIAPGWAMVLYLAEHLVRAGFNVLILQDPAEPFPKALPAWVRSEMAEDFASPAFAGQLRALDRDPRIRWILPVAEDAIFACRQVLGQSRKTYPRLSDHQFTLIEDKHRMSDFARSVGLTVPQFTRVASAASAVAVAETMGYPVVVKGNGGRGGQQVAICQNPSEVAAGFARLAHANPIVARFIEGNTWAAGGFFVDGEPLRMHIYECVQCLPARTGPAIEIRHEAPAALERDFRAQFRALRWNGFASADFIAGAGGKFHFLEMNPRLWGGVTSALAAGNSILDPLAPTLRGLGAVGLLDNKNGSRSFAFPRHFCQMAIDPYRLKTIRGLFSLRAWRGIPSKRYWKTNLYYATDAIYQFARYAGSPLLSLLERGMYQK